MTKFERIFPIVHFASYQTRITIASQISDSVQTNVINLNMNLGCSWLEKSTYSFRQRQSLMWKKLLPFPALNNHQTRIGSCKSTTWQSPIQSPTIFRTCADLVMSLEQVHISNDTSWHKFSSTRITVELPTDVDHICDPNIPAEK